jgi:hypothetical protein
MVPGNANLHCHRPPGRVGKAPGEGDIVKIFGTRIGFSVEYAKTVVGGLRTCKVVVVDRLAERS